MKKVFLIISMVIVPFCWSSACDIKFNGPAKDKAYKPGDEVIIEVTVTLTHRNCHTGITDTKFTYEGLKILGATDWKETQPGTYVRQIKTQIIKDQKKEARLIASRKCDKDGGYGVCTLKKQKG
jgi:hypothetical protein